jgi:hypothetical protein
LRKTSLCCISLLSLLATFLLSTALEAQVGTTFNQRDDQYRLLGLKRAKAAFEFAREEFRRKQELFDRQLISQLELERARNLLADAEVNYQQSLLAVLFEKQYVTVSRAVKRQGDDGHKYVRLTLANASGGGEEFRKLLNIDDRLFRSLQPDVINDVYVSLLNDDNVIISQPYEVKLEKLRFGHPMEVEFMLLQDLDAVTVDIVYGSGTQRSPQIFLQKDATENKVIIQSEQFSQEAELGGEASFDLTLELFSGRSNTFMLEVANLPAAVNRRFVDPTSQARLRQFKFTESANTRTAALKVFLPDRATADLVVDKPIPFYVLAVPRETSASSPDFGSRSWTQQELEVLQVGLVRLELVPRGVGKLLVRAPQLFHSVKPTETASFEIQVVNEGTRRLDNVEIEADTPLGWTKVIEPRVIDVLPVGEERNIALSFSPPAEVVVGRYEFRVRTTSLADSQPVSGEEKNVTIEVQPTTNVVGTLVVVLMVVGLTLGMVVFGIRLSRR